MIVADSKPLAEVFGFIADCRKVLILGCGECVTVCHVGGEKEVAVLTQALRLKAMSGGKGIEFIENTVRRQCDPEFVAPVLKDLNGVEAVISIACGVGVNFLADRNPLIPVFPGVNTTFMGATVEHGIWEERCAGCGQCILHFDRRHLSDRPVRQTHPQRPLRRHTGREVRDQHAGEARGLRLGSARGTHAAAGDPVDKLAEVLSAKDWSSSQEGGPRRRIRADLRIAREEEMPGAQPGEPALAEGGR